MSAYKLRFVDDEAEESNGEETTGPSKKQVNTSVLEKHMKSKKQLYACLIIEGKGDMPQFSYRPDLLASSLRKCGTATFMQ